MAAGPHAEIVCDYFQHLRMLLVEGFEIGDLKVKNLGRVTAKELYVGYTSTFPPPKVITMIVAQTYPLPLTLSLVRATRSSTLATFVSRGNV